MSYTSQLQPYAPPSDDAITDLVTALVSGTTGIPPSLVRPRWQETPPAQPPAGTIWCAIGIVDYTSVDYPYEVETTLPYGPATEAVLQRRWGTLEVLASFYGPGSGDISEQFRDAAYRNQNLASLATAGIKLTAIGERQAVPDLTNYQWINHYDVKLTFARETQRYYPGQSVIKTTATLTATDANIVVPLVSAKGDPFTVTLPKSTAPQPLIIVNE